MEDFKMSNYTYNENTGRYRIKKAEIWFPNFAGTQSQYNQAGKRNFKVAISEELASELEDSFDIENMLDAAESHKKRFAQAVELMRAYDPECLPMGAGGCNLCRKCAYPDEPCRFPDKAFTSMEAYGLYVAAECKKAGLEYNYGPNSLTYSSCILFND
jgi:predicted metal-binding protein